MRGPWHWPRAVRASSGRRLSVVGGPACDVLTATAIWWKILLDPESRELDDEFSSAVDRAIANTEAWTDRAPDDPASLAAMATGH